MLPKLPKATNGNIDTGLLPFVSVSDVLGGMSLDPMNPFDGIRKTALTKEDKNVLVVEANKLAPTMRAAGPPVMHYKEDRYLTVQEYAALHSFPRGYKFH